MKKVIGVFAITALSCGGSGGGSFTCEIGSLSGTWRTHYDQTNGTCGPIPDETFIAGTAAPAGCTIQTQNVSTDHCRVDSAFTCPTNDHQGTQSWVTTLTQTSATQLTGSGTVQATHPAFGTCRSTYNLTVTKI